MYKQLQDTKKLNEEQLIAIKAELRHKKKKLKQQIKLKKAELLNKKQTFSEQEQKLQNQEIKNIELEMNILKRGISLIEKEQNKRNKVKSSTSLNLK